MNDFERPSNKLIEKLKKVTVATACNVLRDITGGTVDALMMDNLRPLWGADYSMCGPAATIKYEEEPIYKHRLSMRRGRDPSTMDPAFKAKDSMQPGDIVVNAALGHREHGNYGDVVCYSFKGKGAAGLITDGVMKDTKFIRRMKDFPVYTHMGDAVAYSRHGTRSGSIPITATDYNVPVICDNVIVRPGDIILADESVILIPIEYAEEVVKRSVPIEEREVIQRKLALTGMFKGNSHMHEEEADKAIKTLTREQAERFDLLQEWKTLHGKG